MPTIRIPIFVLTTLLVGCPRKVDPTADAAPVASAVPSPSASASSEVDAAFAVAMDAWTVKTRKACGLKPDGLIFPKTKRGMLEDCNAKLAKGLPDSKFPPLPADTDRGGLSSADGCRYFVDSYVDTQGVRSKFRCKYDPTLLVSADWEMLK